MSGEKATPRPWSTGEAQNRGCVYSSDETGSIIAQCDGFKYAPRARKEIEANAALIVKAVNAFDAAVELRAAIGRLIPHLDVYPDDLAEAVTAFDAKAEGASP